MKNNRISNLFMSFIDNFMRLCVLVYKFIKWIGYGTLFPFVLFIKLTSKHKQQDDSNIGYSSNKNNLVYNNYNSSYNNNDDNFFNNTSDEVLFDDKKIGDIVNSNQQKTETDTQKNSHEGKKIVWEYVVIDSQGKKIKGYYNAYSKLDVQAYLLGRELTICSIQTSSFIQLLHGDLGKSNIRIKNKDLIFMLAQLSTYLKSGITLVDSINILIRQIQKKAYKGVLIDVNYDLNLGESFSSALEKRGKAFPKLLINMVRAAELTGSLPEALDDMVDYYTEIETTRREMISALTYPSVVFLFTLFVVTFVMVYVVPKFVEIYNSMDSITIPKFTKIVIGVSNFISNNLLYILLLLLLILIVIIVLYRNVRIVRYGFQYILMHIPVISQVLIYNEVTIFSKTFSSLLSHNVRITDSMDILNRVTNNEIYKQMINATIINLSKGNKISTAFYDKWAFPIPAYEMIVTGEKTGQLAEMMSKVSTYYQGLHRNIVSRIKALVEPFLIIVLTFSVGIILISIIVPLYSMYQQVQSLG